MITRSTDAPNSIFIKSIYTIVDTAHSCFASTLDAVCELFTKILNLKSN
jgi:hypothetical protein